MRELEIVRGKIQNHYRVVKTDEDLEWNRAIDLCTNIINAHLSCENAAKIERSSRDTDPQRALEVLDKLSFFGGQRAGRELWNDKSREVQDEDIANFNRDIEWLRDFIRKHMTDGWIPVEDRLPEEDGYYLVQLSKKLPNEDYSDRVVVLYSGEDKDFMCYSSLIVAWRHLPEPYHPETEKEKPDWRQDMLRKFDRRSRR